MRASLGMAGFFVVFPSASCYYRLAIYLKFNAKLRKQILSKMETFTQKNIGAVFT